MTRRRATQASWAADGSHQDLDPPDDWYASIIERLHERPRQVYVSHPRGYGRSERMRVMGEIMTAGMCDGIQAGWLQLGHLVEEPQREVVLEFDGSDADPTEFAAFARGTLETWSIDISMTDMAEELVTLFWGDEPHPQTITELAHDRWADDGGSFVASAD